jgi:hypothetical protein
MIRKPRVGVCIIRVAQQDDYLQITVTINENVGPTLTSAHPDVGQTVTDPAEALRMAERFLAVFQ